jgi:hypothetical protein
VLKIAARKYAFALHSITFSTVRVGNAQAGLNLCVTQPLAALLLRHPLLLSQV